MSNTITIGKRLVVRSQIAFVEGYEAREGNGLQTNRNFLGRLVLLNRDSLLIEETPQDFASANEFRVVDGDGIVLNPAVRFRVETFTPTEDFTPSKPYRARIRWRDLDGNDQSKLLVSDPEAVLAIVSGPVVEEEKNVTPPSVRPRRARGTAKSKLAPTQT